jgi:hypothetical protein
VAQGVGPEFKPQYCKKKNKKPTFITGQDSPKPRGKDRQFIGYVEFQNTKDKQKVLKTSIDFTWKRKQPEKQCGSDLLQVATRRQ